MSMRRRLASTRRGPIRRRTVGAKRMPWRSTADSAVETRVPPTSRASARSLGSLASARIMRMPSRAPATAPAARRASSSASNVTPPLSDFDLAEAADDEEADGVEAERDQDEGLAEAGA